MTSVSSVVGSLSFSGVDIQYASNSLRTKFPFPARPGPFLGKESCGSTSIRIAVNSGTSLNVTSYVSVFGLLSLARIDASSCAVSVAPFTDFTLDGLSVVHATCVFSHWACDKASPSVGVSKSFRTPAILADRSSMLCFCSALGTAISGPHGSVLLPAL